jgi:hypothetical protein
MRKKKKWGMKIGIGASDFSFRIQLQAILVRPCGGGFNYLHRSPASRKR